MWTGNAGVAPDRGVGGASGRVIAQPRRHDAHRRAERAALGGGRARRRAAGSRRLEPAAPPRCLPDPTAQETCGTWAEWKRSCGAVADAGRIGANTGQAREALASGLPQRDIQRTGDNTLGAVVDGAEVKGGAAGAASARKRVAASRGRFRIRAQITHKRLDGLKTHTAQPLSTSS